MGWYEYDSESGYEYFEPSWYYAVAVGRNPGIYARYEDAVEQVHGFPDFRMRKFDDFDAARDYLEEFGIYCDSETQDSDRDDVLEEEEVENFDNWFYAVAMGRSTGIYLDFEDAMDQVYGYPRSRMDQFLDYDEAERFIKENQFVFMDEEEEKSEELEKNVNGWFYAVAVGRSTGVFMNIAEALKQVHGFSGFKMKKFTNYEEAEEYVVFNQVYSSDEVEESEREEEEGEQRYYAVAVGRCTGVYTDCEDARNQVNGYSGFRMKKFRVYNEALEYIEANRAYLSDEEEKQSDTSEEETWYYAVAIGRHRGIYTDHQDAMDQVSGYSGFRMKKFLDFREAQEYMALNEVYFSEDEAESDEEDKPQVQQEVWYYAVAIGRSAGIYRSHEDALTQVHGYSGFRMKKFLDYDEAQEYISLNRVYSSDEEWESEEEPEEEAEVWYYAVAVGRSTGVYTDWEKAKNQVHGYSGFRMKKFFNYGEALEYIIGNCSTDGNG